MKPHSFEDNGPPLGGPASLAAASTRRANWRALTNPLLYPLAALVASFAVALAALFSTIAGLFAA